MKSSIFWWDRNKLGLTIDWVPTDRKKNCEEFPTWQINTKIVAFDSCYTRKFATHPTGDVSLELEQTESIERSSYQRYQTAGFLSFVLAAEKLQIFYNNLLSYCLLTIAHSIYSRYVTVAKTVVKILHTREDSEWEMKNKMKKKTTKKSSILRSHLLMFLITETCMQIMRRFGGNWVNRAVDLVKDNRFHSRVSFGVGG